MAKEIIDCNEMCRVYQAETEMLRERLKLAEEHIVYLESLVKQPKRASHTPHWTVPFNRQHKGSKVPFKTNETKQGVRNASN
jgi:hypothetical protein